MNQTLLLVDGHSTAFRAYYGIKGKFTNRKGFHTNAIFGFFNILWKVMEDVRPSQMAICFDRHEPTFRHEMFKEYKGTRKPMDPELREQIPVLQKMLEEGGVSVLTKAGFEADDLIGTLAKQAVREGKEVMILSGDRDLLQLVEEHIFVILPKAAGTEVYTPELVKETYGVTPQGFLQMKGLMGDTSDNIPGVPKIGEKTAMKIIQDFGTVEEAITHADEVKPPLASKNLKEFADQARFSLELATICCEVPTPGAAGDVSPYTFHTKAFIETLKDLELRQHLARIMKTMPKEKEAFDGTDEESPFEAEEPKSAEASFENTEEVSPFETAAEEADSEKTESAAKEHSVLLAMDEEEGEILGASIDGSYTDESIAAVLEKIQPFLEDPSTTIITFDAKRLYKEAMLRQIDVRCFVMDAMIAGYLLNASSGHLSIEQIIQKMLEEYMESPEEIRGTGVRKMSWSMIPDEDRKTYFETRDRALFKAAPLLKDALKEQEMWSLYTDIEFPLIEVLASMENEGIRVDPSILTEIGTALKTAIASLEKEIYDLAGEEFNINSTKQLGVILFEKLQLPAGKKTKSGYSTSAEVLANLRYAPIVDRILVYRQLSKLQSTYVEGLTSFIREDGKIHCHFQQAVTATGRLSCTDPNLQNIPIRDEYGRQLRRAFVPDSKDSFFMDADYSQIELRLVAHMSGDENMIESYRKGADIHRLTASQVLHIPYEEITDKQRSSAKAVNFGIIYGMSAFSLANDLGMSNKEAKEYIESYFARFPKVESFLNASVASAKEKGYGKTIFGRRRVIEELSSKNFALRSFGERVAKNMPIQGSAADIIKIAMIRVYRRLKEEGLKSRLIVQVHDELLIETDRGEADKVKAILLEEMEHAAELAVPLTVDVHSGENWYEAK